MRYPILLLLLLTFSGTKAQVQLADAPIPAERIPFVPEAYQDSRLRASGGSAQPVWTEDFESGLNGWTINTINGPVAWHRTSVGNLGGFTPGPLRSTTGYPGGYWIVADSDADGIPGIQENATITSPPITGLDTIEFMILRFEQSFRQLNNDITNVEVSGNGGATWTVYPVNRNIPGNQSTPGAPGAQCVEINISDALNGGSGDIRIRFRWLSSAGFAYSWQVDDVALIPAADNDLRLLSGVHSVWSLADPDFATLPYTIYPDNQLRPLTFRAILANYGATTQTGVHLQVDIDGPGTNDATLSSPNINLPPGATDTLMVNGFTLPNVHGGYDITFSVQQNEPEDSPDNNMATTHVEVSPFTFARDAGAMSGELNDGGDEYFLGNWFHVKHSGNVLYGVDVALSERSDPGSAISVTVFDDNRQFVAESDLYPVQASDLNDLDDAKFMTIPLDAPLALVPNSDYLITVHFPGGAQDVWTATSGTSAPGSSLLRNGPTNNWYYVSSTPMVRMNMDPTVGMAEMRNPILHGLEAFPTLFSQSTELRFTLRNSAFVSWQLFDLTGRMVASRTLGTLPAGLHSEELDGSYLSPGQYIVRIDTDGAPSTLRVIRTGTQH